MKTMVVLVGIPGAGKTFVREHLFAAHKSVEFDKLSSRTRNAEDKQLMKLCKTGVDIVVDAANVSVSKRRKYIRFAKQYDYRITALLVDTSMDLALARMALRKRKVPQGAIEGYARDLVIPTLSEGFDAVITLWDDYDPRGK